MAEPEYEIKIKLIEHDFRLFRNTKSRMLSLPTVKSKRNTLSSTLNESSETEESLLGKKNHVNKCYILNERARKNKYLN